LEEQGALNPREEAVQNVYEFKQIDSRTVYRKIMWRLISATAPQPTNTTGVETAKLSRH
jgi:hypothetical protein